MKIRTSHILSHSKQAADKVLYELSIGKDFAEVAKLRSTCPSREQGGDLGFFGKGQMVKEFEDVAFGMKIGEVSGLVKTQFGFHVIKMVAKE